MAYWKRFHNSIACRGKKQSKSLWGIQHRDQGRGQWLLTTMASDRMVLFIIASSRCTFDFVDQLFHHVQDLLG